MKLRILPLALVALTLPAMAQDRSFSLFYDKAPGTNGSITQTGSSLNLKPDDYSGLGLKFGVAVAKWGPATLSFDAAYRFKSKEDLTETQGGVSQKLGQFEWGYVSVGADFNFTKVVDFGGGLDLRAQQSRLIIEIPGASQEIGVNRLSPWLKLHVGYTFDMAPVKPFVALEGAWDLNAQSSAALSGTDIDVNKAYGVGSPKSEWSLQAGIRF
ncbi:MAG TPA: hypothetical protein VFM84_01520 [Holophagaceae bacterium]|nr:hypothetical protein [Holophagaceae bacterium]